MLYLVFAHTAEEPPLRMGPMSSFKLSGASIVDHRGAVVARHNGQRWTVEHRSFYRIDCAGPVLVSLDGEAGSLGPFDHFSLFNGTAYASRDVFAHFNEHDGLWHLHASPHFATTLLITPA